MLLIKYHMNYDTLFRKTFETLGVNVVLVPNSFDPPYSWTEGWRVKLPEIDFSENTIAVMHFQDRVTVVDQRVIELDIVARHYGNNASKIVVAHMHPGLNEIYTGPIHLIEFSNHNYELMNNMSSQFNQWHSIAKQPKVLNWQCLNGRTAAHRWRAADVLQHWPNGVLSYANEIPLRQWDFSTYAGSTNEENFQRLASVYGQCAFNIVTETVYDEYPGLYSEKTLFAFLAHQIPIIISTPRLVEKLREQGFDMFDDIVDHSYDTLPNDVRVEQALELNKNVILGNCNTNHLHARLVANKERALSMLPNWYRTNFETRAREIVERLVLR
jgi:hypothetical protein